jgi:hypothetical protein
MHTPLAIPAACLDNACPVQDTDRPGDPERLPALGADGVESDDLDASLRSMLSDFVCVSTLVPRSSLHEQPAIRREDRRDPRPPNA